MSQSFTAEEIRLLRIADQAEDEAAATAPPRRPGRPSKINKGGRPRKSNIDEKQARRRKQHREYHRRKKLGISGGPPGRKPSVEPSPSSR